MSTSIEPTHLNKLLYTYYDLTELRELCFELGIEHEDFSQKKDEFTLDLVTQAQRRGYYNQLLKKVADQRPSAFYSSSPDPLLHNLPTHTAPFVGRHTLLQQLAQAQGITVITGMGGSGKSRLMRQFAEQQRPHYAIIWWINVDGRLQDDYLDLGQRLGSPHNRSTAVETAINWICHTLSHSSQRWLLLFDSADQADLSTIQPYLPSNPNGRLLITSRHTQWSNLPSLPLTLFTAVEIADFWHNRLGPGDEEARADLADTLGALPLALEQAAAYMKQNPNVDAAAYKKLFQAHRQALWQRSTPTSDYPSTISGTWDIGFQMIQKDPAAVALFNLCCYLSGEQIPLSLLSNVPTSALPRPLSDLINDPLQFNDVLTDLARYALISRTADGISLHKLVQAVARDRMLPSEQQAACELALTVLGHAWHFDNYELDTWASTAKLLLHLLTAVDAANTLSIQTEQLAILNSRAGFYINHSGNPTQAQPYMERALAIYEQLDNPENEEMSIILNNLGNLLKTMGDLEGTRPYLERALAVQEKISGPNHPDTAFALNSLGMLLRDLGDLDSARPYLERALAICEAELGPDDPETARNLNSLGTLLRDVDDLDGARPYLERALAIRQDSLEPDHPDIATSLDEWGLLLQKMDQPEEAQRYFQQALAIYEKVFGPDHPETAVTLTNLGLLLKEMEQWAAAQPYLERALAIYEHAFGPDHPDTANLLNELGTLMQQIEAYEQAQTYFERALAIYEETGGPDNPDTGLTLNYLGLLMQEIEELEEAKTYFQQALAIYEEAFGPDAPETAVTLNYLADLLLQMDDLKPARAYAKRALAIFQRAYGPDDPDTENVRDLLDSM